MGCILFSQASSGVNFLLVECVHPALQLARQVPKNSLKAIDFAFGCGFCCYRFTCCRHCEGWDTRNQNPVAERGYVPARRGCRRQTLDASTQQNGPF
jgi:hypothetical protein